MALKIDNPFEQPLDVRVQSPPVTSLDMSVVHPSTLPGYGPSAPVQASQAPPMTASAAANGMAGGAHPAAAQMPPQHSTAAFFQVLFKGLAVATYLLCTFFSDNFVLVFVTCVLLLAFDFWTVKNVTGRLLVGLRWWNEVKEDGTTVWIFESRSAQRQVHPTDSLVFWATLYGTPLVWMVFGITALAGLKFQWLLIVVVALVLSIANCVGFWKCQKDAKQKLTQFLTQRVVQNI